MEPRDAITADASQCLSSSGAILAGWGKGTTTTIHCFPQVVQCWLAGAKEPPLPHTAFLMWCNIGWLGQRNHHYHTLLSSCGAILAGWGKGTTTTTHCFPNVVQYWLAGAKERSLPHTAFLTWCNIGWLGQRNDHYHTLLSSRGAILAGWGKGTTTTTHCFPHVVQYWLEHKDNPQLNFLLPSVADGGLKGKLWMAIWRCESVSRNSSFSLSCSH